MVMPRMAFGEALVELGRVNPDVVVLDADVSTSTQSVHFGREFPDRFYEVGVAEQNMFCMAAGLATVGRIPFASTFACFVARRAADQISISIAYPKLNVKINGGYGGVPTGKAGATHQAFEDIAFMRAIPNMTVVCCSDGVETKKAVFAAARHVGPLYLRTARCELPVIFDEDHDFQIGRSYALRQGDDVAIISTGMMTPKAKEAGDILAERGISAHVVHMPTLKPFDEDTLVEIAGRTGRIVTIENHNIIGGLGGAVAEVLSEKCPARLVRLGIRDHFGESGDNETLFSKYGMNVENIVEAAERMVRS